MKNRKFYVIFMAAIMLIVSGCGNQVETNKNTEEVAVVENKTDATEANEIETDTETVEGNNPTTSPAEAQEFNPVITEKDDSELNMKDYYYYLEDKTLCTDDNVFDSGMFEFAGEGIYFLTTEKVPMYASNGIRTGYIKEDIDFLVIATCGDWCYFYLNDDKRYARLSDIENNSLTLEEVEAMRAEMEEEAKAQAEAEMAANNSEAQSTAPVVQEAVPNNTVTEQVEVPAESDKYTPEEAIAVYRSLMEEGGIAWTPSLKGNWDETIGQYPIEEWNLHMDGYNGGSWGTGFIFLDKGYAEWAASTDLESCAMGDSVGHPYTSYYLEVTGSDDECVYFTSWH